MSFFERLKTEASAEWRAYTEHPFIVGLADGTLPETAFRHYLVQDYLFLIEFARAYALAVYKSPQLATRSNARATTNPYRVWIDEYAAATYQEVATKAPVHLDHLADLYVAPAREAELIAIFKEATRLDTDFWEWVNAQPQPNQRTVQQTDRRATLSGRVPVQ
jgi:thiaminase